MMTIQALQGQGHTGREGLGSLQLCRYPEFPDLGGSPEYAVSDEFDTIRDKDTRKLVQVVPILGDGVELGHGAAEAEHAHPVIRIGYQGATGLFEGLG